MRALDRYLAREILLPAGAALLFLAQLLLASQVLAQADVLLGAGATVSELLAIGADLLPHLLGYVLPVAFLLGAVLGVARLADDRELVAMGAAGLSPARLTRVPLALGAAAAALALVLGLWLEPAGLRDARRRVNALVQRGLTQDVRAGVFYTELPGLTLYVEGVEAGRWHHVLLSDATEPGAPLLALAQGGHLVPEGAGLRLDLAQGEVHRAVPDAYTVARFDGAALTLGLGPVLSDRNRLAGSPFELGPAEIAARAREATDPAEARRWRTFLHRRLAGPLSLLAFALLAVPVAAARRGGRAAGYAAVLFAVVASYALLRAGEGLSQQGVLPPWLGPQLPNLALALLGAGLTALMQRRGVRSVR